MVSSDKSKDVMVKIEGAEMRGEAGRLSGECIRNYYSERPWTGLVVALLGAVSSIVGYVVEGGLGLIVGVVIALIVAVLPPARTLHRDKSVW